MPRAQIRATSSPSNTLVADMTRPPFSWISVLHGSSAFPDTPGGSSRAPVWLTPRLPAAGYQMTRELWTGLPFDRPANFHQKDPWLCALAPRRVCPCRGPRLYITQRGHNATCGSKRDQGQQVVPRAPAGRRVVPRAGFRFHRRDATERRAGGIAGQPVGSMLTLRPSPCSRCS